VGEHFQHTHCGKYLNQTQEADFHSRWALSAEEELEDQGGREIAASTPVAAASASAAAASSSKTAIYTCICIIERERKRWDYER
jgi:hypothetical protein